MSRRLTDVQVAKDIAENFELFESREMPLWAYDREVELVRFTLRCLANPRNGWSGEVLDALRAAHNDAAEQPLPPAKTTANDAP